MITKFEAVGIFSSVALMAIALFLLRLDSTIESVATVSQSQTASVVVVDDEKNRSEALYDSLSDTQAGGKLVVDDVKVGTGAEAQTGDTVRVHYIGRLSNGQEFDNSNKRGEPFEFTLGEGDVIAGWDQGVVGMKVGGERILVVPPSLGYGARNVGPIPANATLIFAVELVEVL
jgi:peptidylprolyl isomerase/FKBP-type peptidyl-prolyl cis-trans isomerase FkpA